MIVVASAVSLTVADVAASSRFFTGVLGFREELVVEGFVQLRRDDGAMDIELRAGVGTATNATVSFTVTDLLADPSVCDGWLRGSSRFCGMSRGASARCC